MSVGKRRSNRTGRDPRVLDRRANQVRQCADAVRRGRIEAREIKPHLKPDVEAEASRKPMRRPEAPTPRKQKDVIRTPTGRP